MDRVTLSNPMAIILVGLPGSGKSFFANQFASNLEAPIVSEDKIRWTLFAHHTYSDSENTVVKQVASMIITELLKTKQTFILDGGYDNRVLREKLIAQVKKAGFKVVTIVVQTDPSTAQQRSKGRNSNRVGDRYKQALSESDFTNLAKKYQAPLQGDKTAVVISGRHTYPSQARIVLKKIFEIQSLNQHTAHPGRL